QRWRLISSRVPRLIPPLAGVGLMSYSLYLIHAFVLMHWYWFGFTRWHIRSISLVIMIPLSVGFAWLFFRVFERPFMTSLAVKRPERTPRVSLPFIGRLCPKSEDSHLEEVSTATRERRVSLEHTKFLAKLRGSTSTGRYRVTVLTSSNNDSRLLGQSRPMTQTVAG